MLRFYNRQLKNVAIKIAEEQIALNENVWQKVKEYSRGKMGRCLYPIVDDTADLICYGYQDDEANRELRMLQELEEAEAAIQFTDFFPEYNEVVVYGCNELAVSFVEYLKKSGVEVSVAGQYWSCLGYDNALLPEREWGSAGKLTVYAEGVIPNTGNLYEDLQRSVSPEFECIDKIYEANVLEGRINDTNENFDELVARLKEEREVVILGTHFMAQDTYDLLYSRGLDIYGFVVYDSAEGANGFGSLLGKPVISFGNAMKELHRPVFINCQDTHSALGGNEEYFDYYGYKRNKQFFLIRDYTDIPFSNLIHVLQGKNVLLMGNKELCGFVEEYLNAAESGEVHIEYADLEEHRTIEKDVIVCLVLPDYHNYNVSKKDQGRELKDWLTEAGVGYTDYYVSDHALVLMEQYLNRGKKYSVPELKPKGILLGRIPGYCGSTFFRGLLDGHPQVLMMQYSELNHNLFVYCILLAQYPSSEIFSQFEKLYSEFVTSDAQELADAISNLIEFERSMHRLLKLKERFTSQELFVLFHIAYVEMAYGVQVTDISNMVVYWDSHYAPRGLYPSYAFWLEDESISGWTIILRRDNLKRIGSFIKGVERKESGMKSLWPFYAMFWDAVESEVIDQHYTYWKEFKMRFEDIKLSPKEMLTKLCERIGIKWSETLLQTTLNGRPTSFNGNINFDLKAVFNKYEQYLSEFDHFRVSIACSPYQKKHGYSYEDCMKFSRRELQEMFLKSFRFQEGVEFTSEAEKEKYYLDCSEYIRSALWGIHKYAILDNEKPEFEKVELRQSGETVLEEYRQNEIKKLLEIIKSQEKIVFYGTGNDCMGILRLMENSIQERLLYCDKRAQTEEYFFQGKKVLKPEELCAMSREYIIIITSSKFYRRIRYELIKMGIEEERIFWNQVGF